MKSRLFAIFAGGVLLGVSMVAPPAKADVSNQAMEVTFQQPVRIPGQVLQPGTYWFTLPANAGVSSTLNNVEITNADGTKVIADLHTQLSDPAQFGQEVMVNGVKWPTGKAVVTIAEGASGQPATLLSWYYPGRTDGHQFVYSSRRQRQLDEEKHVTLSFRPGDAIAIGRDMAAFE